MEPKRLDFNPLGKRVLVQRVQTSVGGFSMSPEQMRESHPDMGIIKKVGQIGLWNKYVRGIRPGRKICFVKFSPVAIRDRDEEYIFVELGNVLGFEV